MNLLRRPWQWLGQPSYFSNGGVLAAAAIAAALTVATTVVNVVLLSLSMGFLAYASWRRQQRKG